MRVWYKDSFLAFYMDPKSWPFNRCDYLVGGGPLVSFFFYRHFVFHFYKGDNVCGLLSFPYSHHIF